MPRRFFLASKAMRLFPVWKADMQTHFAVLAMPIFIVFMMYFQYVSYVLNFDCLLAFGNACKSL
ncbi:hypothetical protein CAP31_02120 [Sulfuriferula sp. AH1]|uniref:hypothetical protein n=1 Tax=Sulfuriferula sp. AH1 TaxID=1985873 RepID=UPI000B3B0EA7|nr:hypothetical protein [Sulfuriferula sp. AH1]ARU30592.1 hypothetical protein CAP31_02120 [Sulfuriferula sp. AH1]